MHNVRKINNDLFYVGASDRHLALFESIYPIPEGVSYNSYLIKDTKNVLFDTVDKSCLLQFYANLEHVLGDETLDYIVVHHMEPDHAAVLGLLVEKYPEMKIICNTKTQNMITQFFDFNIEHKMVIVNENDTFNTGHHELVFCMAPMVHWPEVMVTYDKTDKILFTADAFGAFGAINGNLYDNEIDWNSYINEARRYYTNIVGKLGNQVQALLKKAANLDIKMICPLHGVIIKEHIKDFVEKYQLWSTYTPEEKNVMLVYSSVHGNTEAVINKLASLLADKGIKNIKIYDISYTDSSKVLADAFKYSHIVLATTTHYNAIFESMRTFINILVEHNLQNRTFALIENGSWAPCCNKFIKQELEKIKNTSFIEQEITIKSSLKEFQNAELEILANKIVLSLK